MAQPIPADYARRLAEARAAIAAAELDSLLVASQHNRRYLTGFSPEDGDITESVGWALVTPRGLYLITGTFSLISLEHEIVPSGAELLLTDKTPAHRLLATTASDQGLRRLGFEQAWISYSRWDRVRRALADVAAATELVPCESGRRGGAELPLHRRLWARRRAAPCRADGARDPARRAATARLRLPRGRLLLGPDAHRLPG